MSPLGFNDGLPARVWRSGAVQLVQSPPIMPPAMHPRCQLDDDTLRRIASVLYMPVFDPSGSTGRAGAVAVLEVFTVAGASDGMLDADAISYASEVLGAAGLSVSDPRPLPPRRSTLAGRRARPPASEADLVQPSRACDGGGEECGAHTWPPASGDDSAQSSHARDHSGASGAGARHQPQPCTSVAATRCSTHPGRHDQGAAGDTVAPCQARSTVDGAFGSSSARPSGKRGAAGGAAAESGGEEAAAGLAAPSPRVAGSECSSRSGSDDAVGPLSPLCARAADADHGSDCGEDDAPPRKRLAMSRMSSMRSSHCIMALAQCGDGEAGHKP